MHTPAQILRELHNTPGPARSRKAQELGCREPDDDIRSLFCDAGLIALGVVDIGTSTRVYYQTPEGQVGETEL